MIFKIYIHYKQIRYTIIIDIALSICYNDVIRHIKKGSVVSA